MHVCVCVCAFETVHVYRCVLVWSTDAHGHVEARSLPLSSVYQVSSTITLYLIFEWQGLSMSLELSDSVKQAGQPPASTLQHSFYMGVQDQSSDPHTCMASSLLWSLFTLTGTSVPSFPTPTSLPFLYLSYFPISYLMFLMFWAFQKIYFSYSWVLVSPIQSFYLLEEEQHSYRCPCVLETGLAM